VLLLDGAVAGPVVVVVGERGTILRSGDHAQSWQPATSPALATLTGVCLAPDGRHGWAVGHDALILATSDGGLTWAKQDQGDNLQDSFLDVLALDAMRAIAIGAYGLFAQTTDGGRTWTRRPIMDGDLHLNRISRGPTGTLYIAGESGTLLRSLDAGASWTPLESPYPGSFYGIVPIDDRRLVAHGLRGHLFRSTDDGETWEAVPTPLPVMLAAGLRRRNGSLAFGGQAGTLLISSDGGASVAPAPEAPGGSIAELLELDNGALLALGEDGVTRLPRVPPPPPAP
jgi:photosystem II stability/assembly factor-like uncharacterized protein